LARCIRRRSAVTRTLRKRVGHWQRTPTATVGRWFRELSENFGCSVSEVVQAEIREGNRC
jgi:hypothetical protein